MLHLNEVAEIDGFIRMARHVTRGGTKVSNRGLLFAGLVSIGGVIGCGGSTPTASDDFANAQEQASAQESRLTIVSIGLSDSTIESDHRLDVVSDPLCLAGDRIQDEEVELGEPLSGYSSACVCPDGKVVANDWTVQAFDTSMDRGELTFEVHPCDGGDAETDSLPECSARVCEHGIDFEFGTGLVYCLPEVTAGTAAEVCLEYDLPNSDENTNPGFAYAASIQIMNFFPFRFGLCVGDTPESVDVFDPDVPCPVAKFGGPARICSALCYSVVRDSVVVLGGIVPDAFTGVVFASSNTALDAFEDGCAIEEVSYRWSVRIVPESQVSCYQPE